MRVSIDFTDGPAKGKSFSFEEPDCFVFGRDRGAKVSLPEDPYVSRKHFMLVMAPPSCKVFDLDSKNGLLVNGVRYGGRKPASPGVQQAPDGAREATVRDGDRITVGDTRATIAIEVDAICAGCGLLFPNGVRERELAAKGGFLCPACAAKQKSGTTLTLTHEPQEAPMLCSRCHRDVRDEAGAHPASAGTEYVCNACRAQERANPSLALGALLETAAAQAAGPSSIRISGYRIDGEIGRGGVGIVYRAAQERTSRVVAIKTMLPDVPVTEKAIRSFQREVEVTRQLKHPNIVELIEHGKVQGTFYFVLEFVDGMDLRAMTASKGGKLELADAAPLMLDILAGLEHAHRAVVQVPLAGGRLKTTTGVVHRDLKPENILLARGERWIPKVADFGLAKSFESAGLTDMTSAGGICGTPQYWSIEQITHYRYLAPPTDVFSVAGVFYEMLTGTPVRDGVQELFADAEKRNSGVSMGNIICVITEHPIVPIRKRNAAIPKGIANVLDRALREKDVSNDPNEMRAALAELRYPDAGAFREALRVALKKEGFPL
jgi:serine/threonine-protein kinase